MIEIVIAACILTFYAVEFAGAHKVLFTIAYILLFIYAGMY